jgi:hypothetical protein
MPAGRDNGIADVNANDAVAFVVEIVVLGLLAAVGWQADASTFLRVVLAVGFPLLAAVMWGLFAAPRARVESEPLRLATKLVVLGLGVIAGFVVMPFVWAIVVAVVVVVNTVLIYVGPFARRRFS